MTIQDTVLRINGAQPPSTAEVAALVAACTRAEELDGAAAVVLRVSGAPERGWTTGLTTAQVSRWERALRRLERVPAATIAVAEGDCGGAALDALLIADHRIAARSARLVLPVAGGGTWPGMASYRLGQQAASATAVRRAVLFGEPVSASDAVAAQLIDEAADNVEATLAAALERARPFSGPELAIRRQLLADARSVGFDEALGVHLAACDRVLRRVAAEAEVGAGAGTEVGAGVAS